MKALFAIWIVALAFLTIGYGIRVGVDFSHSSILYKDDEEVILAVSHAGDSLWGVGWFLKYIADILVPITLAELASGFVLVLTGSTRLWNPSRIATLGLGLVFMVLDIAWFALLMRYYSKYYAYLTDPSPPRGTGAALESSSHTLEQLSGALDIMLWIATLPIVVYTAYVVHKAKAVPHLRNSTILLLTASLLNFIRMTAEMAITCTYYLRPDWRFRIIPLYVPYIVRPVLDCTPMFVLLILLFVIGIRKQRGLWSTQQPQPQQWAPGMQPYVVPVQPGQQQPMIWQGQPPLQGYYYPQQQMGQVGGGYPHAGYPVQQQPPQTGQVYPHQGYVQQPEVAPQTQQPPQVQEQKAPGVATTGVA